MTQNNNIIRFPVERTFRVVPSEEKLLKKPFTVTELVNMYIDDIASYKEIMEYAEKFYTESEILTLKVALGESIDFLR